jgi:hypothetical protein
MKSIERPFRKILDSHPYWSSIVCFAEVVRGKGFGEQRARRQFNKLVDKDDYASCDRRSIYKWLFSSDDKKVSTKHA